MHGRALDPSSVYIRPLPAGLDTHQGRTGLRRALHLLRSQAQHGSNGLIQHRTSAVRTLTGEFNAAVRDGSLARQCGTANPVARELARLSRKVGPGRICIALFPFSSSTQSARSLAVQCVELTLLVLNAGHRSLAATGVCGGASSAEACAIPRADAIKLLPGRRRWDSFRHRANMRRARSPLVVHLARPIRAAVNHRSELGAIKLNWKALQRLAVSWALALESRCSIILRKSVLCISRM